MTIGAHSVGHGELPSGPAFLVAALMCATIGAVLAGTRLDCRSHRLLGVIGALAIAQALGHVVMTVAGGHHHHGGGLGSSHSMLAAHAAGAVLLGAAIASVEYLYVVCASVLCWWRLFLTSGQRPAVRPRRLTTNDVVAQSVLRCSGLGMRAPPQMAFARG